MTYTYKVFSHRLKNAIHTLVLFLCMGVILSLLGFILAGVEGVLWAGVLGILILAISPSLSPSFIFSLIGGRLLSADDAPVLYQITQELAARANLPAPPALYYLPSHMMNAFSVGTPENSAIGMSDTLLKTLTIRELIGVLAHETSHIQHNDLRVMRYADIINRITNTLSLAGVLLVFLNLPLFFLGLVSISWVALGVLIVAPNIITFLELSLSRMRELDADRQAVLLTGDPEGLAMALNKLEAFESPTADIRFYRNQRASTPSLLRTHPYTEERIDYLLSLKKTADRTLKYSNDDRFAIPVHYQQSIKKPRWHLRGLWD
ncbi:MAG: zinc metalloprotease HtpX [Methylococcales bacterium]|nr:zinc metalloprotease HtpX [Methylococcales bacterium]